MLELRQLSPAPVPSHLGKYKVKLELGKEVEALALQIGCPGLH